MKRREAIRWLLTMAPAAGLAMAAVETKPEAVRGKLEKAADGKPEIETADHRTVELHGDDPTMGVLKDERLAGKDFEALGHLGAGGIFEVDPINERAMFVHQGGKRLMITYWCDVCYIRTYTPGPCWCCQKYTDLDLREKLDE